NYTFNEAHGGEKVAPQTFHLAEGGRHLMLRKGSMGMAITEISDEPTEDGFCPSINRLFSSAAEVWGGRVIAVILTGMGTDGTRGAGVLKQKGAFIIAQDEKSSVVWGMPGSAVETGCVDLVLPLESIPEAISMEIQTRNSKKEPVE
ncbi:MAG: CheB methylesterase domain-containing protein, partial [Candidatus Riflebacteria bacterium]